MILKYMDAHGHVNFVAYKDDRGETIKRSLDEGVWMAVVGTQKDTSKSAVELAEKYKEGVYAIVGLHPIHTDKSFHDKEELGVGGAEFTSRGEQFDYDAYRKMIENSKVVAIGECGLDYYRVDSDGTNLKKQEDIFRQHIELSIESKKPLMLHIRNGSGRSAYIDAVKILSSYKSRLTNIGDVHCYTGSYEEAKGFLDLGFSISFTGLVTFPLRKSEAKGREAGARSYDEIVRAIPIERILAETDCPYLAPQPYRGKRNEPLYVSEVVKSIAEIKKLELENTREQILENTLKFFGL
ncbi:MAG: hypothetical protein A3H57_02450 [Candidatus Taylorbacteria bacterium RIFCSPLOWO2_02_FULL_43_11]|uniref:Hydrolase TatD n=1 Tax=Candidatus Taylorbacteria bacterium RIFCSPHIGHO2_02_FULL_43_32b TaxID=1802306 RepID=A0A1G2MFV6_9BACT|nr:MAG: hypothetical protein A2743_00210 [Candidatus Taylorbacteria bacterium RIFCSPHIGHO2_01_FULL_43_47]OHA22790.1 MAG: hypothetical protein A3C72_02650 [Candidatus Taylorbacteria bacterium RIFCSPHIGHO2_02_FULL_43_32b]OHA30846.1 MAG: hypothetical protein A3B08_01465 [Candidatus Taylorbacteria bacterium RIFCSPLOWO2_01_FULL_43_44]OHA35242.1 MAG: hypothetical protein A3H57_02450 [Candidatus Taylorbacteria bacterium RIFCSPLOWO2_02_FULL_43_11]